MRWATSSISCAQFLRVQLRGARAVVGGPLGGQVERHLREVVGDDLPRRHIDDRGHRDALGVVRVAGEEGVAQPRDLQHRVDAARVQVECPASLVVGGSAKANGQHVFQAQQPADDDRAVGPWTGPATIRRYRPGSHGIAVAAIGGDAGGDVVGVAVEFAPAGDIAHVSRMPRFAERAATAKSRAKLRSGRTCGARVRRPVRWPRPERPPTPDARSCGPGSGPCAAPAAPRSRAA